MVFIFIFSLACPTLNNIKDNIQHIIYNGLLAPELLGINIPVKLHSRVLKPVLTRERLLTTLIGHQVGRRGTDQGSGLGPRIR